MSASRSRVTGVYCFARFWLSALCGALMPTSIGYQDIAALIARERAAPSHWHLIISPVQAATFSYSRPIGSAIPEPLVTVNFDPRSLDAFSWKIDEPIHARPARQIEYPTVERRHKADRLPKRVIAPAVSQSAPAAAPAPAPAPPAPARGQQSAPANSDSNAPPAPAPAGVSAMDAHNESVARDPAAPAADSAAPAVDAAAAPQSSQPQSAPPQAQPAPSQAEPALPQTKVTAADDEDTALADKPPEIPAPGETDYGSAPSLSGMSFLDADAGDRSSAIYFGAGVMGSPNKLQSWAPGAEPILVPPSAELVAQSADANIKLSALEGTDDDTGAGESVAGKDDVSRLQTPAQRLGLEGKARAKAEKCLADAVYFEARGEVRKGQEAVAQVVMNRAFSGYYPHDVCGVVYQNAHRHLACQFTFACERKDLSRIDEPDMWEQAKSIAKDTLDGKIWLPEVGHATHYHAYWVHPSWVHEMTRLYKLGVHTFYRPRNWGDGDDEPVWGKTAPVAPSASSNNETPSGKSEGAKPDAKAPQAAASPAGART
jgi:spore germination cell wall hydrolase CwlJ-like protein